ncbi:hypothetical protein JVU11DRAFT_9465 [Chiua virens]|nr:hypothetical protein JVU11DRAFT_9465 [Chiua virens]
MSNDLSLCLQSVAEPLASEPITAMMRERIPCNSRLPAQYCGGDGGEYIDTSCISEGSSEDDMPSPPLPSAPSCPTVQAIPTLQTALTPACTDNAAAPLAATTTPHAVLPDSCSSNTTCTDPLAKSANILQCALLLQKSQARKYCLEQAGPNGELDHSYTFSCNTSNYLLRGHIVNWHLLEYLELAEKNSWSLQIKGVHSTFSVGYTFRTLHEAIQ